MLAVKLFAVLLLAVAAAEALSCPRCDRPNCPVSPNCKGGFTSDICGCCRVCAKVLGEECGGPWRTKGKCDAGLECNNNPTDFNAVGQCRAKPV